MRHQNLHAQNIESHWLFVMCDEAVETHDVDAGARASKIEGSIRKRWLRATLLIVRPLTKSRPILRIGWNANIWIAICFSHFQYNKHLYQKLVDGVDVNLRMHLPIHLDNPKFRSSERTPKKPHSHTHSHEAGKKTWNETQTYWLWYAYLIDSFLDEFNSTQYTGTMHIRFGVGIYTTQ